MNSGGRFQTGQMKTGGRKRGTPNRATHDVRLMAQRLVQDPGYLATLAERLRAGEAGRMEPLLWNYAYGKPAQTSAIGMDPDEEPLDLSALTTDDLDQMMSILARAIPPDHGRPDQD